MFRLPPISELMSPPETMLHDCFESKTTHHSKPLADIPPPYIFSVNAQPAPTMRKSPLSQTHTAPPSPPVSPEDGVEKDVRSRSGNVVIEKEEACTDPILYPGVNTIRSEALFASPHENIPTVRDAVRKHIAKQPSKRKPYMPTEGDYLLFTACIGELYSKDPAEYRKRTAEENEQYFGSAKSALSTPKTGVNYDTFPAGWSPPAKRRKVMPKLVAPKPKKVTEPRKPLEPKKTIPRASVDILSLNIDAPMKARSATPDAKQVTKRNDDVDFLALPDYSPPLSTLPSGKSVLQVAWTGGPVNLSTDPNRYLLHEAEFHLASTLRLSCATYLCSKRRIFQGRLHAYLAKKEFRKTDAQQACKIDVNKASKLWAAYDKVGWFKRELFEQYL